jgi:hypothetical protein
MPVMGGVEAAAAMAKLQEHLPAAEMTPLVRLIRAHD